MKRYASAGFYLLISLFFSAVFASETEPVTERIDALFQAYDTGKRPGYAIGIIRAGKLIHARGYGYADITTGQRITTDSAFNLASLSKQFTAAAIALEIQNDRLDLDDLLSEHWTHLPAFAKDITIGHLIFMTSGLPEYYQLPSPKGSWLPEAEFTVDDAIQAVFSSNRLDYMPGTRWTYSNTNYQLLAVLSVRMNDASFSEHLQKAIFQPLQMTHSWVDAPIDTSRDYRASNYIWDEATEGWRVASRLSPHYGGSGVFSSLNDLARWDSALYHKDALGKGFRELMLTTRKYAHDKTNDAFGLVLGSYQGQSTIWYEGGDYGVSTYMVRLPERDETIICLANFSNADCAGKARSVIDVLLAFTP